MKSPGSPIELRFRPAVRVWVFLAAGLAFLLLAGCAESGNLIRQPRYDPLSPGGLFPNGQSAQAPVPGSVSFSGDSSPNSPALTGVDDKGQSVKVFPAAVSVEMIRRGQDRYNIFCVPCHGAAGAGDGMVTTFGFPKPPSLLADEAKALTVGDMFQIIQNGKGKMFSYGYRVKPADRWAVIAYIRALELKNGPVDPQKLTPADLKQIGGQ